MNRNSAIPYVSCVIDDALSVSHDTSDLTGCTLVGWQCGFEPMFVAVRSYLPGCTVDETEAAEIATDYLEEKDWFSGEAREADYILLPE
jgi:hypothetical protein